MSTDETPKAVVKKVAAKSSGSETTKRVFPQKLQGWIALVASAFGPQVGARNWSIAGFPKLEAKKAVNDSMTLVKKPVSVILRGSFVNERDGKIFIRVEDTYFNVFKAVESQFMEDINGLEGAQPSEGLAQLGLTFGDDMVSLKSKYFTGKFTKAFVNGDLVKDTPDLNGKTVSIIVKFYGRYIAEEVYGPLVSVAAYNVE